MYNQQLIAADKKRIFINKSRALWACSETKFNQLVGNNYYLTLHATRFFHSIVLQKTNTMFYISEEDMKLSADNKVVDPVFYQLS